MSGLVDREIRTRQDDGHGPPVGQSPAFPDKGVDKDAKQARTPLANSNNILEFITSFMRA